MEKIKNILANIKAALKKVSVALKWIFGYGMMITLFAGGLTFFAFLFALIIGGDTATEICIFVREQIFPILIKASTSLILLGLVAMYFAGETALTAKKKKKA